MNKKWGYIVAFSLLILNVEAQSSLGYQIFYRFMDYPNWNNKPIVLTSTQEFANFSDHMGVGLEYSKQVKKTSLNSVTALLGVDYSLPFKRSQDFANAYLLVGFRFYPFNQADCDCPSFYQQGSVFSRGFNITPKAGMNVLWLVNESVQLLFAGGADLALDIPLTKTTTLSPFGGVLVTSYAHHPRIVEQYQRSNINSIYCGMKVVKNIPKRKSY